MDAWDTHVRCNKGDLADQSDFEVGKSANFDLLMTVRYDGHVWSMVGVHM